MVCPPDLSFSRTLPTSIFNQLGELLEQMSQAIEDTVLVFTEAVLTPVYIPDEWQKKRFIVMISQHFSVLLVGNLQESEIGEIQENNQSAVEEDNTQVSSSLSSLQYSLLKVRLTFNSDAITSFLSQLRDLFGRHSQTHRTLNALLKIPGANDPKLQSQFTLLILEYFLPVVKKEDTHSEPTMPAISVCQPVENAL